MSLEVVYTNPRTLTSTVELRQLLQDEVAQDLETRLLPDNPVKVTGNKFDVDPTLLERGQWYDFMFKGRKYVVHKRDESVIEIYKVK